MAELYKRAGSPYWYAYLSDPRQPDGLLRKSTRCRGKAEAREVARVLQQQIEDDLSNLEATSGLGWLDAATMLVEQGGLSATTAANYRSIAKIVYEDLGDFDLGTLTHEQLKLYAQNRRKTEVKPHNGQAGTGRMVSDATIRRHLSCISAVYEFAIGHQVEGCLEANPVRTFDRRFLRESPMIDRHLRPVQFTEVLSCCKSPEHRRLLIVLVATGMRSSELINLYWKEVDLQNDIIEFGNLDAERTKSKRSRRIPLHPVAKAALAAQKAAQQQKGEHDPEGLAFPSPVTKGPRYSLSYLRKTVQKRTGLKGYTNHGLRHTFASWALQDGADPIALRDVLGHTTLSTSMRYARHVTESVASRFRALNFPVPAHFTAQSIGLDDQNQVSEPEKPRETKDH